MVEYILVLAVVATILIIVFPMVRTVMNESLAKVTENLDEGLATTSEPKGEVIEKTTEVIPPVEVTPPTEIVTPPEVVQTTSDTFSGFPMILAIIGGFAALFMVFTFIVNTTEKKRKEKATEQVKAEENPTEQSVKEEVVEVEDARTWEEKWAYINHVGLINPAYIEKINQFYVTIEVLLPQVEQLKWTEDVHELNRIKEDEIPQLVTNFINLKDEKRKKQEKNFTKTLQRIEHKLAHVEEQISKLEEDKFTQTVRVIETRYEE